MVRDPIKPCSMISVQSARTFEVHLNQIVYDLFFAERGVDKQRGVSMQFITCRIL